MEAFLGNIEHFLLTSGAWAPIIYVLILIVSIALSPIPSTPLIVFGGRIFGFFDAVFWSMLGIILGLLLAFVIGRRFGRPLLVKFFDEEKVKRAEKHLSEKHLTMTVFLVHLLPLPFLDVVSYVAGMTTMRARNFAAAAAFGYLPSVLIFSYFGYSSENFLLTLALAGLAAFFFVTFLEAYTSEKNKKTFEDPR